MTINDKVKDKKLQYNINKEAAKVSALSSSNILQVEHEYPTGGDILPSDQSIIIEQEKFT